MFKRREQKRIAIITMLVTCVIITLLLIISNVGIKNYRENHSKIPSDGECCNCYDCLACDMCCSCDNIFEQIIKGLKYSTK